MRQLDRYVARTLLGAVGLVMAVLVILGALVIFIDEQSNIGVGRYDVAEALVYSVMNVPRFALDAFPAGVLIGAMLGVGALARSHELTAMRAGGMSKWRLSATTLGCGVVLLLMGLAVGEFLAPRLEQMADERRALARYNNLSLLGAGGAWVRDGNLIINIAQRDSAREFAGMWVYEMNADGGIAAMAHAQRASNNARKAWQLGDYAESRFTGDAVQGLREPSHQLASAASANFLQLANVQPSELSLSALYRAIRYLSSNELDARSYLLAFWSGVARSAAIPLAVLFALPFGFGSLRSAGSGARSTLGLAVGLVYFFLQRTVQSGAVVFNLNPLLLAWLPTLLLAAVTGALLVRTR